jgi:hypothetical protein
MTFFVAARFLRTAQASVKLVAQCAWGLSAVACASAAESGESDEAHPPEDDPDEDDTVSLGPGGDGDAGPGGRGAIPLPMEILDEAESACLRLMSWGKATQAGAVPGGSGMDAIVTWLNSSSTVMGAHFAEKPVITSEFLAFFDVLLLQDLSNWEISQDEHELLKTWVQAGGGVMALAGFQGDSAQVLTTNQLLSFSGMNYVSITEPDTALTLGACAYCVGSAYQQGGFNGEHPISEGVSLVGAYEGRSIGGSGAVVAQEYGKILGMTSEVGAGRVFLFHDDWVTYYGQWSQAAPSACSENPECSSVSPPTTFQMSRFWFNSLRFLSKERACLQIDGVD